jgi:hypothetical protein
VLAPSVVSFHDETPGRCLTPWPALQSLLESASAAGEVRADVNPNDLLHAVANLCLPADAERSGHAHRMVDLLIDGLR